MYDLHPKVEEFVKKKSKWAKEIEQLRELFLSEGLVEDFKWGQPCYTVNGKNVVAIGIFKEYIGAMFFKGALIKDPDNLLVAHGDDSQSMRSVRTYIGEDIASKMNAIQKFAKIAKANEEAGKKIEKVEQVLEFPEELLQAFSEDVDFETAFKKLTPGRQRAYNLFFKGAKQSQTRVSRIEKYYDQILEGKGMND